MYYLLTIVMCKKHEYLKHLKVMVLIQCIDMPLPIDSFLGMCLEEMKLNHERKLLPQKLKAGVV